MNAPATAWPSGVRGTGWAGLAAIATLAVYIVVLAPKADSAVEGGPAATSRWLDDPATAAGALPALAVGALSYALVLLFLGGATRLVAWWDPEGPWAQVVGISAGLFVAGAMASDVVLLAVPLARHVVPQTPIDPGLVAVLDQAWLIALVEAQVALGTALGAAAVAGALARRRGANVPRLLLWLGAAGALATIPLVLWPTEAPVLLATNQLRLAWIVALSVWLVTRPVGARPGVAMAR